MTEWDLSTASPVWSDPDRSLEIRRDPNAPADYLIVFPLPDGEIVFSIRLDEAIIEYWHRGDHADASTRHFLMDQVLPRIVSQISGFVLHAAATNIENRLVLLLGPTGTGKSTLCASFDAAGFPLVGDDAINILAGEGEVQGTAVYRSLRLYGDAMRSILSSGARHSQMTPYSAKRSVDLGQENKGGDPPRQISAVFFLEYSSDNVTICPLPLGAARSCMRLVKNSFALDPTDAAAAKVRFDRASLLTQTVPAFSLSYPRRFDRLSEVRDALLGVLT